MTSLPSGTVTLLFSDIEGSTALLSRLGDSYAEALKGQRSVLRRAWSSWYGIEMGTEGDSFFVVFDIAENAVRAALQGQRDLEAHAWPADERVRVRMGVHTGAPALHEDGYIGMDVHRAARIAAAAHGGQIVISEATKRLLDGCPDDAQLRDLGQHQLKDIPQPEHLYDLTPEGLDNKFPPIKSLGAATRLPVVMTPLVGRDGELEELLELLSTPVVRLVTLTGPGGSGKTRLATELAARQVTSFPDGVYFVPLAAATSSQAMWSGIAETLDVPLAERQLPELLGHLRYRAALLVLDNLEQLADADVVVAELLDAAPESTVVATSRRPLHLQGEHEHAVPPLDVPESTAESGASAFGAVQLFVQHAQMVRSDFVLNAENRADVVAVCARLDGLPLAIELAAARIKLLSPRALLHRLDASLDLADSHRDRPSRQQTMRSTIAWSYDLLPRDLKAFFRRLGVFSGGAGLEAIHAVTTDLLADSDPLEWAASLVDVSLVTVSEGPGGEPRVATLDMIRSFALDRLLAADELEAISDRHADYFLGVAQELSSKGNSVDQMAARDQFEAEYDNLHAALMWSLQPDTPTPVEPERTALGLKLCSAMVWAWERGAYHDEKRRWCELAVERAGGIDGPEHAACLKALAGSCTSAGEYHRAKELATAAFDMSRRLGEANIEGHALMALAWAERNLGNLDSSHDKMQDALRFARGVGDSQLLAEILTDFSVIENERGDVERSIELLNEGLAITRAQGDSLGILVAEHNMACMIGGMGRVQEARSRLEGIAQRVNAQHDPIFLATFAEDFASIIGRDGDARGCARLLGASNAMRERMQRPRSPWQEADLERPFAAARASISEAAWQSSYAAGQEMTVEAVLAEYVELGDVSERR